MQWLAALCIKRPVFASVLILSITVIGLFSFMRLGVDQFPKIDFPTVVITTVQPGASPEQIETEVTDKIEEAVNTISGIDELRSTSSEGVSLVMVSFLLEKDGNVSMFSVKSMYQTRPKVAMIDVGMAIAAMIVERMFARNSNTTSAARMEPSTRCSSTLLMAASMNVERSRTTRAL